MIDYSKMLMRTGQAQPNPAQDMEGESPKGWLGVIVFLSLTFGIAWFIELALVRRHALGSAPYLLWLIVVMFVPGLSALFVRLVVERKGFEDAGLRWGRGRYYLMAWLIPVGFGLAAMALTILLGQAEFDPWMTELMLRLRVQYPNMEMPPFELLRWYVILGALTQGMVMNFLPCLGEEFGWRGYLLIRLLPLGPWRAAILSGAIWGVWHAPVILQGHNYPSNPLLGVPLMVGFCILLGVVFSWLTLASGSVFPAAVGHASINGPASTTLAFMRSRNEITGGIMGLLGQGVMLVFVLALWRLGALRRPLDTTSGGDHAGDAMPESRTKQQ